jgi:two-component system NarL family response regulator
MSVPTPPPIRLLIVDDHALVRAGIVTTLLAQGGIEIVAQASHGADAVAQYVEHRPDVALIDLQLPGQSGIDAMSGMRAFDANARMIVLTTFGGDARIMAAMRAGASAYLLKNVAGAELARAIHDVHQRRNALSPAARHAMQAYHPADALSRRELEVLELAAAGNSNRLIGDQLQISETTVKTHMSTILVKLGANDRTHAATLAVKLGYFSL